MGLGNYYITTPETCAIKFIQIISLMLLTLSWLLFGHLEEVSRDGFVDFSLQNTRLLTCEPPGSRYFSSTNCYQSVDLCIG